MKIKAKLLFLVSVPVIALLIVTLLGLFNFENIGVAIQRINTLHLNRATMIDADRDAYQAQMALGKAEEARSVAELSESVKSCEENLAQTWERISGPSSDFTPAMSKDYAGFKQSYSVWKERSVAALEIKAGALELNVERAEAEEAFIQSFGDMRDVIDQLGEIAMRRVDHSNLQILSEIFSADRDAYQAYVALLLLAQASTQDELGAQMNEYKENVLQTRERFMKGAAYLGVEAASLKDTFLERFQTWSEQGERFIGLTSDVFADNLQLKTLLEQSDEAFSLMRGSIDNLGEAEVQYVDENILHMNSELASIELVYIIVAVLFVSAAIAIAMFISSRISKALQSSAAAASQITSGDFDVNLPAKGKDEAAQLQAALNSMASTLRANIVEIESRTAEAEAKTVLAQEATTKAEEAMRQAEVAKKDGMLQAAKSLEAVVVRVATATDELSLQGEALRKGSDIQAERIQSTASAMEEMNATVLEVARNASEASEVGNEAKDRAIDGFKVVTDSTRAMENSVLEVDKLKGNMNKLDEQAQGIGAIIGVINDIADQTNLLALNAAIEAARAGEAGRGFAVVADEVRKLAEKTMTATQEVGESVNAIQNVATDNIGSMEKVYTSISEANEHSTRSGEMLKAIVTASETSADQIQSIATAAEEQSATSEEINHSIEDIDNVTSENAKGVTESALALNELAEQMAELKRIVDQLLAEGQTAGSSA